ncbi:MAG TPA: sugar transferase [Terriglobia bacterium]|nr:sugar transferase [Terriglobia bacterium]
MIDQRKRIFAVNLWFVDLVLTTASFYLAYRLRQLVDLQGYTVLRLPEYLWLLAIILPVWAVMLPLFRVYSDLTASPVDQVIRLTKGVFFAWLTLLAAQFFVSEDAFDRHRLIAVFTLVINYFLLVAYRIVLIKLKKHGALDVRHVAVVGSCDAARDFARKIEEHRVWGLHLVGIFDQKDVKGLLERGGLDELIVVTDNEPLSEFTDTFLLCEELGVTARVVLNFFPHSFARTELEQFGEFPLLSFSTTPTNEALFFVRRIMDLVIVCIFGIPILLVIGISSIAIRVTSPGPVFFKQERCGLNGRLFTMYKLRSMVNNSEQARFELETLNEMDGPVFKSSRDPRRTKVGKFLRKFSIDEFPQFYNVLRGDMSLVGPRPPLPQEVARYERWQRRRLSMKPGITCLWQISGRNEISFQEWMKLDLTYIDNWSLLLDLKILLKTVPVVLLGRGAR